ncbi:histidine--tRNA ligase [bacterium]|nr:histidine--tRNA ligase [bacterium]
MEIRYRRPRGTRDVMLEEMERWLWCEERWRAVLSRYGFGEIRTPLIEPSDLFVRSVGEGTDIVDKEMYSFETKGGERLTLRPEATASVVRAYLENGLTRQPGTLKFYYMGPMFRYDRPQAGRYRQFHQVGVEAVGSSSPVLDAEVIRTALAVCESVGAENLLTQVNTIGCPDCRPAYVEKLRAWARERREDFCATCQARMETNALRLFDCKEEGCRALMREFEPIDQAVCPACRDHHAAMLGALDGLGVNYEADPTLVRGLDYYTRTTFEISARQDTRQSALCGGGRYDGLIEQCGGPATPSVGFSIGVERLIQHLWPEPVDPQRSRQTEVDVLVVCLGDAAQSFALRHVDALRAAWRVEVDTTGRGAKAQMKGAVTRGARVVLIAGDDEVSTGTFQMKILATGVQNAVAAASLADAVEEVLQP